jgi:hypothetical protein
MHGYLGLRQMRGLQWMCCCDLLNPPSSDRCAFNPPTAGIQASRDFNPPGVTDSSWVYFAYESLIELPCLESSGAAVFKESMPNTTGIRIAGYLFLLNLHR